MGGWDAWKVFAGLAGIAALAALASKSPGAWGLALSWGMCAAGAFLWRRAQGLSDAAAGASEAKARAYAKGEPEQAGSGRPASLKAGAACALGAIFAWLFASVAVLGCAAFGAAWALAAAAPLAGMAAATAKASIPKEGGDAQA